MKEYYAYVREGDEITLLRCWGSECLSLPDTIDGLPVTRLADHIFAAEPSRQYRGRDIRIAAGDDGFKDVASTLEGGIGEGVFDGTTAGRNCAFDETGNDRGGASCGKVTGEDSAWCRTQTRAEMTLTQEYSAAADRIRELHLPRFLREIGSYAFYGCRCLKRLVLPDTLNRLGRGIFTACGHIEEIRFVYSGEEPPTFPCLREILGEIEEEIFISCGREAQEGQDREIRIPGERSPAGRNRREDDGEGFCLLFPGYIEESIENTPARIIEVKFEGMGYQYRQCFRNGEIDFSRYDGLFYLAGVQEKPSTSVRLCLGRLCVPFRLEADCAAAYLRFLQEHAPDCADYVLGNPTQRIGLLLTLRGWGYFDRDLLDYWSERCVKANDPLAVSLLTDIRREKFPSKKKEYVF